MIKKKTPRILSPEEEKFNAVAKSPKIIGKMKDVSVSKEFNDLKYSDLIDKGLNEVVKSLKSAKPIGKIKGSGVLAHNLSEKQIRHLQKNFKFPKIKKKRFSLRKLCKLAWDAYGSKYYRFKDLLDRGNQESGLIKCVTCSTVKHWKEFEGGHFIPKAKLDAWLLEDNAHCQCFSCNHMKGGNIHYYTDFMIEKYGAEKVAKMKEILYRTETEVTREYIAERREFFKSKLKEWKVIQ